MLIAMPSAPFADMSSPISYKAFYFSNLLKLEDFFLSTWALLNKENQVHNKRNPQKIQFRCNHKLMIDMGWFLYFLA